MKKEWLVKTLALGIVVLFICISINPSLAVDNVKKSSITSNQNTMSVVSSTDNFLIEIPVDYSPLESVISSEEKFFHNTTWYMFIVGFGGTGFYAEYPNGTYLFKEWEGDGFFSGGTWTNDGRYLCCMYENGTLYDINPETFDACSIGNGGISLNGLAYNPVNGKLFGASGKDLYEIDITTGEQTHIGAFGIDTDADMIAIAFDIDGICYGWDVNDGYRESYLYKINTSTGEATIVGGMDVTLCYAQDGDFDKADDDALWLSAFIISPEYGCYLLKVDKNTGEILSQSPVPGTIEIDAFAISYNYTPPVTTISFDPSEPNGCNGWYVSNVTVTLNATDNYYGVKATYYKINNGEWQTYESPFIISEDGDDILIEYYSINNAGYVENVKNSTLDIDKTPPETSLEYETWKEDCKWYVKFIFNVTDSTSGAGGRVEWSLNDVIQKIDEGLGPTYEWTIKWSPDYRHSYVIFKATTWDKAGNQANESTKGSDIKSYPFSQSSQQSLNKQNLLGNLMHQQIVKTTKTMNR